jgi:hypothetical protein
MRITGGAPSSVRSTIWPPFSKRATRVERREVAAALRDAFEVGIRDVDQRLPRHAPIGRHALPPDRPIERERCHRRVVGVAAQHGGLDLRDLAVLDLETRREHRRQAALDDGGVDLDAARGRVREHEPVVAEPLRGGPQRVADAERLAVLGVADLRRERRGGRVAGRDRRQEAFGELLQAVVAADDFVFGRSGRDLRRCSLGGQ